MEKILTEIDRNSVEKTVVQVRTFKGHQLLDIRVQFLGEDNQWHPTRKGVAIKADDLEQFMTAITEAARLLGVEPVSASRGC